MKLMTSEGINRLHLKMISETKYNRHTCISYQTRLCLSCNLIYFSQHMLLTNYVEVMDKNEYLSCIYVLFYTSLLYRYRTYYKT